MVQSTMFLQSRGVSAISRALSTGLFLAGMAITPAFAQTAVPTAKPVLANPAKSYRPNLIPRREAAFYESVWGIGSLSVKSVESGELIRFTYRVLDPAKSALLNDKKLEPALIFPAGHIKLVIPALENVGQLRQVSTPEAGRSYWMAFSNPGRAVKPGDRVDVAIGNFHAEGLFVE